MQVLDINENLRLMKLERHVVRNSPDQLLFEPLRHFIGEKKPERVLREIAVPPPEMFIGLNPEQQRVAHPLSIRTATECAGPPGTGKSLVRIWRQRMSTDLILPSVSFAQHVLSFVHSLLSDYHRFSSLYSCLYGLRCDHPFGAERCNRCYC